ncbi:InlB B-repeat-containing protein [Bifidobacterium pseudocatenulatum]|uniref:InlB B-repeat-containing protein n=1 Tax=Bifidobacterium pseudocatenulatum TaxID=28026 RepID=UPI001CFEC634|nr:InlB B-repeat-containing protein [Bifidobacterium pseudocatenulatum]MCB4911636.1 InlB B-repeat-containing protein [Bifidobacterium pseudocatenulatum]
MGFFTRLIAGLVAASTLGAGLAGTAGAVDTTGTTGDAKGVVKLASDDTTNGTVKTVADENVRYGSLVNGDFSYPSFSDIQKNEQEGYADLRTFLKSDDGTLWYNMSATDLSKYGKIGQIPGFDSSRFAWSSTENGSRVELQQDRNTKNTYAEIVAQQDNTSIYQNVSTGNGGVLYKIRLKHASRQSSHADRMQVLVGSDTAHATPVEMTRVTSNGHGDKVGGKSTTITTKVSNTDPRDHGAQWETYEGCYQVPEGQKNTVFMFKSLEGFKEDETLPGNNIGNLVDDIEFSRSYKLTYDANSSDASGQVPSDTAANTIRQTKARTTGTVHLASDDKNGLPDHLVNGDFEYPGANVLSKNRYDEKDANWWGVSRKDKMVYDPSHETQWVSLPSTFDSDRFAWDSTEVAGTQNGSSQWHTNEVELQRDSRTGNMYGELCAYQANTSIRQYIRTTPGVLYKVRLKHASLSRDYLDKMQVLIGPDGNEQPVRMTRVESRNGLDATGESTASTTVSTHVSNEMEIKDGQGTPYSSRNHNGQWATYEGAYVATSDVTSFTFKSVDAKAYNLGNLLDDIVFDKAYRLSYDKNATDANGSVPSDETAGATKQAKSKTNGSVRLAADDDVAEYAANGLPEQLVNSDFDHDWRNIVGQSKMTDKYNFANVDPAHGDVEISGALNGKGEASKHWVHLNGFDAAKFGWKSNQTDTRVDGRGGIVEIQRSKANDNMYAEITASQANTYLYQDIDTAHDSPTVYTVKLRYAHRNGTVDSNEKIQILVGAPGHEQPVEMTRIASDRGNKVGEKSTTVNAPNTAGWLGSWDTFQGSVEIPAGQPVSRFTFKALGSVDGVTGNLIDDVQFKLAYPLSYDKNAQDATGSVPSSQYGKENTVQPAKAKTTGSVKTVADDDSSKSLTVNPGFDVPDYSKLDDGGLHWMYVSPAEGEAWSFYDYINPAQPRHQVAGLSQATFGWQELTGGDHKTTSFELHREKDGNVCADVHGSRTIGQTIDTQAGVAYTVSIRHSGRSKGNAGSVQVLVGPDKDHLRPLEMSRMNVSRTGAKYGDRIGKVGTVITTHSDSVDSTEGDHPAWDHSDDWETYSGTYVATGGKTVFAYRGVDKNGDAVSGTVSAADSVIDDLSFRLAYPLSYDKNSQDASGSVPSGKAANTVQPAKAKTTGSVRLAADKTASGLTVHDLEMNDVPADYRQFILNTTDTRLSQVEFEDGAWYKSTDPSSQGMWPLRIGASLTIPSVGDWTDQSGKTHQISMTMRLKDWNGGSVSELYRFDGHGNIVGDGRFWINTAYGSGYSSLPAKVKAAMGGVDTSKRVGCSWMVEFTYADTGEKVPDTFKGVTGFNDLDGWDAQSDLKFEGVQLLSGFDGAYKRSDVELGTYGMNGFAGIGHDAGDEAHLNAPQQSRHRLAATWTGSTFTFSYDLSNPAGRTDGSRMTFGAPVTRTAVLTYDKNAADASGQVPSNTTPDTTQTASSKSTGKVSDLVQRTTTHEDGSVTVKTIDTSTDVVSGCQVYYPAGQRITLATLAKDDDCWDSSMLTRPGHTQLGWNQDSQATQAQAEVTMVEGGMTVYAVWIGNPVLTYDTNKPNTWTGQMPSTPASVSVAYNTPAADGSGWQSGDLTKIRGYRFLGWYAGPQDDSGLYDWNTLLTGSVTVYAHWERLKASVVYDRNAKDAKGSHANTDGWQYSDVTVPSDTSKSFTRAGYVFLGWDTQADGNGTAYKDGSQVPLQDKDITLYAQWQPVFEQFTPTGGVSLPLLVAGGVTLLVMGIGSTVMLTRRMRGEQ